LGFFLGAVDCGEYRQAAGVSEKSVKLLASELAKLTVHYIDAIRLFDPLKEIALRQAAKQR
jgi:hypothetical protein